MAEVEEEQRHEKLANMQEICACDDVTARENLEKCNWQLDVAVQEYLNVQDGRGSLIDDTQWDDNRLNETYEYQRNQNVRHRQPRTPVVHDDTGPRLPGSGALRRLGGPAPIPSPIGWMGWSWSIIMLPFRFCYTTFWDIMGFIYNIFFRRPLAVTDPEGDVKTFIEQFETKYGRRHPKFWEGSYSSALNEAKRGLKFLLVYLHSGKHQDSDKFCKETLANKDVIQFIEQHMMLWGCDIKTPEGHRVSSALRETTYPFLALICFRDNRMAMVMRMEGPTALDPNGIIGALGVAVQDNEPYLRAARQERETHQQNQRLREEQEQAYADALVTDRRKRDEEMEAERRQSEELRQMEMERQRDQDRKTLVSEFKELVTSRLPDEPSPSVDGVVKVSLKFPSGTRCQRKFCADATLEHLYRVAYVHPECPDNFSLVCSYPRKVLEHKPKWLETLSLEEEEATRDMTLADVGLEKAVVILVQNDDA